MASDVVTRAVPFAHVFLPPSPFGTSRGSGVPSVQLPIGDDGVLDLANSNPIAVAISKERILNPVRGRTGRASTILSSLLKSVNGASGLLGR